MRNLIFILTLFLLMPNLYSQNYPSIHQQQLEYYKANYPDPPVSPASENKLPKLSRIVTPSHTVFGYHPYWMGTAWQNYNYNLLTTIAYFSAEVTPTGGLSNLHGWPATSLINEAHSHGVDVVLCATLFSSNDLTTLLSSATNRQNLINNLLQQVQNGNGDGVNIDFEVFPASQSQNLVTFVTDLVDAFHTNIPGSQVTLATPAVDWSGGWNFEALANVSDGLFIMGYDYHYSGSSNTGANAPLTGGSYNVTNTVNTYLSETSNNGSKIILGVPYFGFEWPTNSGSAGAATTGSGSAYFYSAMEPLAQSYGKLWDASSQTPWYNYQSGGWYQGWYDDSASLSLKYNLAINSNLQGIGIWALGYDGNETELWEAIGAEFGATSPPTVPSNLSITSTSSTSLMINFGGAATADEFIVLRYNENSEFIDTLGVFNTRPVIISGLTENTPYYIRIKSQNSFGSSPLTEMLGAVPSTANSVLIVNGFDRVNGTTNTFDYVRQHGSAIVQAGFTFDAVSNEAITSGQIDLNDYSVVDWILGEEGTTTHSFTATEQDFVEIFLENGGSFMVSGSEIGYDLSGGSASDNQFYTNYLKAQYLSDDAGGATAVYSAFGTSGSMLENVGTFSFDDGSHGTYNLDYPDGIKPTGGSTICAKYPNVDYNARGGAGISYNGTFGTGSNEAALVHLSIGFEAIYPADARNLVMSTILTWFEEVNEIETTLSPLPGQFQIKSIYPNPTNSTATIEFNQGFISDNTVLTIYNILGQVVFEHKFGGKSTVSTIHWNGNIVNGTQAPTGIYFAQLSSSEKMQTVKFTILK